MWDEIERRKNSDIPERLVAIEMQLKHFGEGQERIEHKICQHITEGEKAGGFRDRLIVLEQNEVSCRASVDKEIKTIKNGYWKVCATAGVIGGLLGSGAPSVFEWVGKILLH
mgnify:FL=1